MPTIIKQGKGYKITVSNGYDINGKQLREHMTWTPSPGMTVKQIDKELNRQAILFEEEVKLSGTHNGNMRLVEFTELYINNYAKTNLKAKSAFVYIQRIDIINQALGHIKLKDLKPGHIAAFYKNLQEDGVRKKDRAIIKINLAKWLSDNKITVSALTKKSMVSDWVITNLKAGKFTTVECARKISNAVGVEYKDWFETDKNMKPLAAGTIHSFHRVLSAVLCKAVKWGYINNNPASRAELPSIAGYQAKYLDEPDARRLLELLQNEPIKWRTVMIFDLLSGLRRGELGGLRWQDINFNDRTIAVSQTSNYVPGKGVYVDTPKTLKSRRPIKLSQSAFTLLLLYKDWQDTKRVELGDAWQDKDGRVFTNDFGSPFFPDSLTAWFKDFIKRTGLPTVTLHSLRHTYASLMIADGIPAVVISSQLGHAKTSTTVNIYAHVIASAEAKAAQTLDKFNDILIPDENKSTKKIG